MRADKNKPKEAKSQLKDREKAMTHTCPVCKTPCANYNVMKQHMEGTYRPEEIRTAKHPNAPIPPQ
ncbi:hypothetical protein GGF32_005260 [Allomyces javanicus]|nr:hypothetical protein GGF32_005260 [Allomyces javanicus]